MQPRLLSLLEAGANVGAGLVLSVLLQLALFETEKKLMETPGILKMPSGYIQMNPWLTIATKQMELMQRFAVELGMTPSSRSRVETVRRPSVMFDDLIARPADAYLNPRRPSDRFSNAPKPWEM